MNYYKKTVLDFFVCVLAIIGFSTGAGAQTSPQALLNTLVAIPASSSVTLRWVVPPLSPTAAEQAHLKIADIRFSVNTQGIPWIGLNDRYLMCLATGFCAPVSTPLTGFVHLDNGMMLVSTVTKFGYLLAPSDDSSSRELVFQPIAKLPGLYARLFAGSRATLYIVNTSSDKKSEVYRLKKGAVLAGFEKLLEIDDDITAITGDDKNFFVATRYAIYEVNAESRRTIKLNVTMHRPITALALHPKKGLFVATTREICYIADDNILTIIESRMPRICVRGDSLYVFFPESLGVVALDNISSLADCFG